MQGLPLPQVELVFVDLDLVQVYPFLVDLFVLQLGIPVSGFFGLEG